MNYLHKFNFSIGLPQVSLLVGIKGHALKVVCWGFVWTFLFDFAQLDQYFPMTVISPVRPSTLFYILDHEDYDPTIVVDWYFFLQNEKYKRWIRGKCFNIKRYVSLNQSVLKLRLFTSVQFDKNIWQFLSAVLNKMMIQNRSSSKNKDKFI